MNTITRVLHSIFNHRKDIVYRRSSSILISVIRISHRKINLYECPFSIKRRPGLGVANVAILVKVPGSSKLFYLRFFYILIKKNRHEEHKGHAMIFMLTKSVKPPFLDRYDSIRRKPPSQFQKQTDRGRFVIPDGSDEGAILVR